MIVAHVGGVPVEEVLPTLATAGAGVVLVRAWLGLHVRRGRKTQDSG